MSISGSSARPHGDAKLLRKQGRWATGVGGWSRAGRGCPANHSSQLSPHSPQ